MGVSRICKIKRQRTTADHSTMKLAISILFLATTSTGAPSVALRRTMPTGHAESALARNQMQTAMKIQNNIVPWIQHLENILKLSIERQYNETSQLYKYIEALENRIAYLKSDTDENLKAIQENTKENLISLQTMTNWNDEKILEATVINSGSSRTPNHLDTSQNTDSATASPSSVPSVNLKSWSFKEPIISIADVETFNPPRRLPMISTHTTPVPHSTNTTPPLFKTNTSPAPFSTNTISAPHSTKPPCIAGGLK